MPFSRTATGTLSKVQRQRLDVDTANTFILESTSTRLPLASDEGDYAAIHDICISNGLNARPVRAEHPLVVTPAQVIR